MKVRDYLKGLTEPPSHEPTPEEVTEAAAVMLDVVLPAIEALAGIRKQLGDAGLTEESVNEFMDALVRRIVEGM
jgi:hypothetical protein